jgi:hypothetical protein
VREAPQHTQDQVKVVLKENLESFVSGILGKDFLLKTPVGNQEMGARIAFDYRLCTPDLGGAMEITDWVESDCPQPSDEVVLNNLVVRGEMEGGIYIVVAPVGGW